MTRSAAHEASTQQQREYKRVEVLRDALELAIKRIEFNARNAFGTAIYDNRPIDEFGPDWKKEDPEEYSEWLLLRTVLNAKETT